VFICYSIDGYVDVRTDLNADRFQELFLCYVRSLDIDIQKMYSVSISIQKLFYITKQNSLILTKDDALQL